MALNPGGTQTDINPVARVEVLCSLCGPGFQVGNPSGSITIPGQPAVTCGLLENGFESVPIEEEVCDNLGLVVDLSVCECEPSEDNTSSPSPSPSPSPEDFSSPSPSPSPAPFNGRSMQFF